ESQKADAHLQLALSMAEQSHREDTEGAAFSDLGSIAVQQHRLNEAVDFHQRAVNVYSEDGSTDRGVFALLQLGSDYEQQFKRDEALNAYLSAKSLSTKSALDFVRSSVAVRLGWFYSTLGKYEEAETAFREAVQITREAGDEPNLGFASIDLAFILGIKGDWEGAAESANQALSLGQRTKNGSIEFQAASQLMGIYSDRTSTLKDFDLALKYYADALALTHDSQAVSLMQLDLLEIYLQKKDYAKALASAKQGIEACRR